MDITNEETEEVLGFFYVMLGRMESMTNINKDRIDKSLVTGGFNLLNRIGYVSERPRWEETCI